MGGPPLSFTGHLHAGSSKVALQIDPVSHAHVEFHTRSGHGHLLPNCTPSYLRPQFLKKLGGYESPPISQRLPHAVDPERPRFAPARPRAPTRTALPPQGAGPSCPRNSAPQIRSSAGGHQCLHVPKRRFASPGSTCFLSVAS